MSKKRQFNKTKSIPDLSVENAVQTMTSECHRARFAEILSPEEAKEMSTDIGLSPPPWGWALRAELSTADIELLSNNVSNNVRLLVMEYKRGLPTVILVTQAEGVQFRWVVPLWEKDAQEWLNDAVHRGRFVLMFEAVDSSLHATIVSMGSFFDRPQALLAAATLKLKPEGEEAVKQMAYAAMKVMSDSTKKLSPSDLPAEQIRVMCVARGPNAWNLMGIFATAYAFNTFFEPTSFRK